VEEELVAVEQPAAAQAVLVDLDRAEVVLVEVVLVGAALTVLVRGEADPDMADMVPRIGGSQPFEGSLQIPQVSGGSTN
jgi:hypothetical protein